LTAPQPAASSAPPGFDPSAMTILVVDDNEPNIELLLAYLDELGSRTLTARDGSEALALVEAESPDLVLLDIMMPRMSGFQVCEHIRKREATDRVSRTPVIMITALNQVADVERAVEAGADDFLTKPVDRMELVVRAQAQLRVRYLQKQLDETRDALKALREKQDD
jgi:two-component system alkaline phosphatase synthesis response regulator PhoP